MKKQLIIICLISILCYACNSDKKPGKNTTDTITTVKTKKKQNFLDSVAAKADFSFAQIRQHATIDSSYFTGRSKFRGDTVYFPQSDYPVVIIAQDDGLVCTNKFLLVYKRNNLKNTACLLAGTDCDEDYSTDYSKLSYQIFNEKQFYTREVEYIRDPGKKTKVTVTDLFYQVNKNGGIDMLKNKPAALHIPVYEQDANIDDTAATEN